MPSEPLTIADQSGPKEGQRILSLSGPITISNLFDLQARVRADQSKDLILDLGKVPYVDSAGVGALVGAYVTHQREGRSLRLAGVSERVRNTMKVTRVEQFFQFYDSVEAAAAA